MRKVRRSFLPLAVFAFLTACGSDQSSAGSATGLSNTQATSAISASPVQTPIGVPTDEALVLARNRQRWDGLGISKYTISVFHDAEGATVSGETVICDVDDGRVQMRPQKPGDRRSLDWFNDINTVPKLLDFIDSQLRHGNTVKVEYDSEKGYPKRISVTDAKSNGWISVKASLIETR